MGGALGQAGQASRLARRMIFRDQALSSGAIRASSVIFGRLGPTSSR